MAEPELLLFSLESGRAFGENVAKRLGVGLADHEERDFEYGQHKSRSLVNVRDRDVYVVQSLHGDPLQSANDKLCRLLFFIGSLKDAAARRVTAVVPFLCYARKDRKTKSRDPVTTRYVAQMFEAVGVDRVVTLDVHNLAAFQNAFRCPTDHLESRKLFAEFFAAKLQGEDVAIVSPDVGGVKRAEAFREALGGLLRRELETAFMEKQRSEDVVSGDVLVGNVEGRVALIIDDMISSGTTLRRAARACRDAGARHVWAAASHGAFTPEAGEPLADPVLDEILVLDTIPPFALDPDLVRTRLVQLDAAPLFAEAIRRIHEGGSLVDLLSVRV